MMDTERSGAYKVKPVPGDLRTEGTRGMMADMYVKGQKQSDIQGGSTLKSREKSFQLAFFQMAMQSPRDPASGLPTGKRLHEGVEAVGKLSKGVPGLWTAMVENENLTEVRFDFWGTQVQKEAKASGNVKYYEIKLTNANIATMDNVSSIADGTMYFRIRFTYQKIDWTWVEGGLVASDSWFEHQ